MAERNVPVRTVAIGAAIVVALILVVVVGAKVFGGDDSDGAAGDDPVTFNADGSLRERVDLPAGRPLADPKVFGSRIPADGLSAAAGAGTSAVKDASATNGAAMTVVDPNTSLGPAVKIVDEANFWVLLPARAYGGWRLVHVVAGKEATSSAVPLTTTKPGTIGALVDNGTSITVVVNGVSYRTEPTPKDGATKGAGVAATGKGASKASNVVVW